MKKFIYYLEEIFTKREIEEFIRKSFKPGSNKKDIFIKLLNIWKKDPLKKDIYNYALKRLEEEHIKL